MIVVAEDVPQALEQPVGAELPAGWPAAVAARGPPTPRCSASPLRAAPDLVLTRDDLLDGTGAAWRPRRDRLRQSAGMRWEIEVDEAIAALVAACDGTRPLAVPLARARGRPRSRPRARWPRPRCRWCATSSARGFLVPPERRAGRARSDEGRRAAGRPAPGSTVDGESVGAIGAGLLVLVGVTHDDTAQQAEALARKVHGLRVLRDERSVADDPDAGVLVVSQFTLYGDARKGRRPTWAAAAPGPVAEPLVDAVVGSCGSSGRAVETGRVRGRHGGASWSTTAR